MGSTCNIVVAEVIRVNDSYFAGGSEDVVVKDTDGRIWAIPEKGNLISRYDVRRGMRLRLKWAKVDGKMEVIEVTVLKGFKGSAEG